MLSPTRRGPAGVSLAQTQLGKIENAIAASQVTLLLSRGSVADVSPALPPNASPPSLHPTLTPAEPPFTLRTCSPILLHVPSANIMSPMSCRMAVGGAGTLRPLPQKCWSPTSQTASWWIIRFLFWWLAAGVAEVVDRPVVPCVFFFSSIPFVLTR